MIRLFIDGKEADVDMESRTDNIFVITKDYENRINPTAVNWDYSKTISLPATSRNNRLFEHIWNFGQNIMGFNPAKRTPFHLTYNSNLVMAGYFKLNEVEYDGHTPYQYECTLYGSLGDFFSVLERRDLSELRVDNDLFEHRIDNDAVQKSWENEYYKYILSYSGLYDNFASDVVIRSPAIVETGFRSIVSGFGNFYAISSNIQQGLYYSTDNGDSFSLLSEGEYGFSNLASNSSVIISAIRNNVRASTDGSTFSVVYSQTSMYITNTKYALDRFFAIGYYSGTYYGGYTYSTSGTSGWVTPRNMGLGSTELLDVAGVSAGGTNHYLLLGHMGPLCYWTTNFSTYTMTNIPNGVLLNSCDANGTYTVVVGESGYIYYAAAGVESFQEARSGTTDLNRIRAFGTRFVIVGDGGKVLTGELPTSLTDVSVDFGFEVDLVDVAYKDGRYIVVGDNAYAYTDDITSGDWTIKRGSETDANERGDEEDEHQRNEFRSYYQRPAIRFKYLFEQIIKDAQEDTGYTVELDPVFFDEKNPYWWDTWAVMDRLQSLDDDEHDGNIRSGDSINFEIMIKKGISQLDFMINYTKVFGLKYRINPITKTIYILTRNSFFEDYKVEDWSRKMDYNTNVHLNTNPVIESNWLFRWKDAGTYYEEKYNQRYGIDFGAEEIDTGYEFAASSNTKEFTSNNIYSNAIISREHDLYFGSDRGGGYWDDKKLPAFFVKSNDKRDNTEVDLPLLFFNGMAQTNIPFRITDDTTEATSLNIYCWQDVEEGVTSSEYPLMTRLIEKNDEIYSLDFEKPQGYHYPITDDEYPESATIYSRFWKAYIDERLNDNRRQMRARFYLTPIDFAQFDFNKFVIINDTLWHPEQINNFSMISNRTTEVTLYRVSDLQAYELGQRIMPYKFTLYITNGAVFPNLVITFNGIEMPLTITAISASYASEMYQTGTVINWQISGQGIVPQQGTVTIKNKDITVTRVVEWQTFTLTINPDPADADVTFS